MPDGFVRGVPWGAQSGCGACPDRRGPEPADPIGYLGDFMATVDIDALHLARETLRITLGRALNAELRQIYAAMDDTGRLTGRAPRQSAVAV